MMADWELLERLCGARGVSGREDEVRELIVREIGPFADKIEITPLGSVIAYKSGEKRARTKLMLAAHMDEVGLTVTRITDEGLLKFSSVGSIDPRVLPGRQVLVGKKAVPGVVGVKPVHVLKKDEREKRVPMEELYLDIGALTKEEAEAAVTPGDEATFVSRFCAQNGILSAKALDDRAGCALLIGLMKKDLKYDAVFAFTVQEEVGSAGAKTAAFAVEPDAAIVVEATTAADVPGTDRDRQVCRLGDGPAVSFMDKRTIYDAEYYGLAFRAAKRAGMKCQPKQAVAGTNDAAAIHVSRGGVRTVAVSLPCRYLHAPVGVVSQEDYESAAELLAILAEKIAGKAQPC